MHDRHSQHQVKLLQVELCKLLYDWHTLSLHRTDHRSVLFAVTWLLWEIKRDQRFTSLCLWELKWGNILHSMVIIRYSKGNRVGLGMIQNWSVTCKGKSFEKARDNHLSDVRVLGSEHSRPIWRPVSDLVFSLLFLDVGGTAAMIQQLLEVYVRIIWRCRSWLLRCGVVSTAAGLPGPILPSAVSSPSVPLTCNFLLSLQGF